MSIDVPLLNPATVIGAMPFCTPVASPFSCAGSISSYRLCDSSPYASQLVGNNRAQLFAQVSAGQEAMDIDIGGMAIAAVATVSVVLLATGALAAIGHKIQGSRQGLSSGLIPWTRSGLDGLVEWVSEKIVAVCTIGKKDSPKTFTMPESIQRIARLIHIHKAIAERGWQPYRDLSVSERFGVLMKFAEGERADEVPQIGLLKSSRPVLNFKHKDGHKAKVELNELSTFAGGLQIFRELHALQLREEWYGKWCQGFDNGVLSDISERVVNGEKSIEVADKDIESVTIAHEWTCLELQFGRDQLCFIPEEVDSIDAQTELLEECYGLLDQLEDIPIEEKTNAVKMLFAHLITKHLNGKRQDGDIGIPMLFNINQLQGLMNQNPEFFDEIQWEDIPEQVEEAMAALRESRSDEEQI